MLVKRKIGGNHTTIIGGRRGRKLVLEIAKNEMVKKIIPGIIKVSMSPGVGFRAKILRPDSRGNLRLLLREGSTVQEIFIVTRASTYNEGLGLARDLEKSFK